MPRRTHPEGNEGYTAMKKALRQHPKMLGQMLQQRLIDAKKNLSAAAVRNDIEAVSKFTEEITQIESAQQQLALKAAEGEDTAPETDDEGLGAFGETDAEEDVAEEAPEEGDAPGTPDQGLGFAQPPGPEPEEDVTDNPVAMTSTLRRQVGDAAADFLDDYALTVYEKMMSFVEKLRDVALVLGTGEDDEDGITSLREALKDEVGRRGLEAVEPVYDEWLQALWRTITKEMRDMFTVPEAPVDLSDTEVGNLLGLDDVAEAAEAADEGEKAGKTAEEAESEAVKTNAHAGSQAPVKSISEAIQQKAKPLAMATGPISMRVGGSTPETAPAPASKPVSAAVEAPTSVKAQDFVPSGHSTPRLE